MASEHDIGEGPPLAAGADLSAKYGFLVKQSAQTYVLCSAATDKISGVLGNKPTSGNVCRVLNRGTAPVVYGGNVSVDDRLTSDGAGKAIATTTTGNVVFGTAMKAGSAGDMGMAKLAPIFPIP